MWIALTQGRTYEEHYGHHKVQLSEACLLVPRGVGVVDDWSMALSHAIACLVHRLDAAVLLHDSGHPSVG